MTAEKLLLLSVLIGVFLPSGDRFFQNLEPQVDAVGSEEDELHTKDEPGFLASQTNSVEI